jgi:type IV secretory pathway VirB2 component (pilin)
MNFMINKPQQNILIGLLGIMIFLIVVIFPELSLAAGSPFDSVDTKGQEIATWASSSLWTWLSTIAVLIVTAGAFFGKINWPTAITTIIAIVIGFNAGNIVSLLQG